MKTNTVLIIGFIILLITPSLVLSDETATYQYEFMWPVLEQPWYFNQPYDIDVDTEGNVYILDSGNHGIKVLTSSGQLITKWGEWGSENSQFIFPQGIAIDSNGYVYVADTRNHRIQVFRSDGSFIRKWGSEGSDNGQFNMPYGIAVDSMDHVYVADMYNHRIQKFTSDGAFITKWGSKGAGDGQFETIPYHDSKQIRFGIAIDGSDYVYVGDIGNYRIQKFTSNGAFITKWGSKGKGNGQFNSDKYGGGIGLAIDSTDNVYASDMKNQRVQMFTSEGKFLTRWGRFGSGNGEFWDPTGIAADNRNNYIYIAENGNHRIQIFNSQQTSVIAWGNSGREDGKFNAPRGIVVDSAGNINVVDKNNHRIQVFTEEGQFITKCGGEANKGVNFNGPSDIAFDSSGNLYVVDSLNLRIQKFTSEFQLLTKWGSLGSSDGQFGLEFSTDEFVYFEGPLGVALDSSDNVYVVDTANNRIQKFTSEGQYITKWGSFGNGDGQFFLPTDIATDANNNIYVTDTLNVRIQMFTSDGQFITKWHGYNRNDDGDFDFPVGIGIDKNESVYVVDAGGGKEQILQFALDGLNGKLITKFGGPGSNPGQFKFPAQIAFNDDGDVYVSDQNNNRIQLFSTSVKNNKSKAIIVAGGGPYQGNNIWDDTEMNTNYAYRTLQYQGFTKDSIYYLSSDTDLDLDGNGIYDDVDADATGNNLRHALTDWAIDAEDVIVYLIDHGGDGTFKMSETEIMYAEDLGAWLDILQENIVGSVIVIYDACESGSFVPILTPPAGKERIIITSTSAKENAYFVSNGTISFSYYFWGQIFSGANLYDAFETADDSVSFTVSDQNAVIDDNGNGVGNEKSDGEIAQTYSIGNGVAQAGDIPVIGSVSHELNLSGETSSAIWADDIVTTGRIIKVWAVIRPPDFQPESTSEPVVDLPDLELRDEDNDGRYEGTYNDFSVEGTYEINIYAMDSDLIQSLPKATKVHQDRGGNPVPDIKANGADEITVSQSYPVSITITLDPKNYEGQTADWWIWAETPTGNLYLDVIDGKIWKSGSDVSYQGNLMSLPNPIEILRTSTLTLGEYTYYFEIDFNMDEIKDKGYSDSVKVTIK